MKLNLKLRFLTNNDIDWTWRWYILTCHDILLTWWQQNHHNIHLTNHNLINSNKQKTKAFPRPHIFKVIPHSFSLLKHKTKGCGCGELISIANSFCCVRYLKIYFKWYSKWWLHLLHLLRYQPTWNHVRNSSPTKTCNQFMRSRNFIRYEWTDKGKIYWLFEYADSKIWTRFCEYSE